MKPILTPLSSFESLPIEYVWDPYLPKHTLTILEAAPGMGKGFLAVKIAATATRGFAIWPGAGQTTGQPINVVWMTYEDDWSRVVRPRFEAAGGDLDRVFAFTDMKTDAGAAVGFEWSNIDGLVEVLRLSGPDTLIVADPINGFLPAGVQEHSTAQLRTAMQPVMKILQDHHATMIGIRHHRKGNGGTAAEAGAGSLGGWTGLGRSVLGIFKDPEGSADDRVLAHVKCNTSKLGRSLRFSIDDKLRLIWGAVSTMDADELHAAGGPDIELPSKRQDAVDFLRNLLRPGPQPAQECLVKALQRGISKRTLERAKAKLEVQSFHPVDRQENSPVGGVEKWLWKLPR